MSTIAIDDVLPMQYCGLDPLFSVCPKLYICDILNMPEINSGEYKFHGHRIITVDIMGVVVRVNIREKVIIYAVDDNTGVISCCCWKTPFGDPQLESVKRLSAFFEGCPLHSKLVEHQHRQQQTAEGYPLGTLVHIRGNVSTYNGIREIKSFHCAVVDDVNCETRRMLEMPSLYKQYYNEPISLPTRLACELGVVGSSGEPVNEEAELLRSLTEAILHYVDRCKLEVITVDMLSTESKLSVSAAKSKDPKIWQHALTDVEVKGHLYRNAVNIEEYRVVGNDKDLHSSLLKIIRSSSLHEKGANGCHFLHMFGELRKQVSFNGLSKAALQHCLTVLERQSDIASTSDRHYVAIR